MQRNLVRKQIVSTMQEVNVFKKINHIPNGINMTYNYLTDEISFDSKRIKQILERYPHISLEEYVTTFTLHELGHALDRENLLLSYDQTLEWYNLSKELTTDQKRNHAVYLELSHREDEANLNFEYVAWENATQLNNKYHLVPNHILNELKIDSLLTYQDKYERSRDAVTFDKKIPMLL